MKNKASDRRKAKRVKEAQRLSDARGDLSNPNLVPLIRILIPQLTAEEICSVQPMSASTGEIFTLRRESWFRRLWYRINVLLSN